jgi:putative ABC transport system permease protein
LVGCGLAIGFAAALVLSRLLDSLLYGIEPSDPLTFAATAFVLTAVAVVATILPAMQAARMAPAAALRGD